MATKRRKRAETSEQTLARWIDGATLVSSETRSDILGAFEAGCTGYITIETYGESLNYEVFHLDGLDDELTGYVVVEWDGNGSLCVIDSRD